MTLSYQSMQVIVAILGLAGFCISYYLYIHKRVSKKPIICPMNFKCDQVVRSEYSKTFGVPNEIGGMIYYAYIAFFSFAFAFSNFFVPILLKQIVAYATIAAVLFSIYLVYVQAFKIKEWCSWCLISAILSVLIFAINFFA